MTGDLEEMMTLREVCLFFGGPDRPLDPSTVYRGIKLGRYPKPIKISRQNSRWRRHECLEALNKMKIGTSR